jgi:hypothetical protein
VSRFVERPTSRRGNRVSGVAFLFDDIVKTETNGLAVRVERQSETLRKLRNMLRSFMGRRGLLVSIAQDGEDALLVWVRGRKA